MFLNWFTEYQQKYNDNRAVALRPMPQVRSFATQACNKESSIRSLRSVSGEPGSEKGIVL
jgi:hypothetical protein